MYDIFEKNNLKDTKNIYDWTLKQAYISVGNMMTAAAKKEIDSCAIEGFEKEKVEKILNLDTSLYQVALVLPLGYRNKEPRDTIRLDFKDVVEYVN